MEQQQQEPSMNHLFRQMDEAKAKRQAEAERKLKLPNINKAKAIILYEIYKHKVLLDSDTFTGEHLLQLQGIAPFNPVTLCKILQKDGFIEIQKNIFNSSGQKVTKEQDAAGGKVIHKYYITNRGMKVLEYVTGGYIDDQIDFDELARGLSAHAFLKNRKAKLFDEMDYKDDLIIAGLENKESSKPLGSSLPPGVLMEMMNRILPLKK